MKKRGLSYTVGGNVNWCSQTKNRVSIWSWNPTPGNIYEENSNSKHLDRWIDKEGVVHIYRGMLPSHEREWNNAICSNMDGPRDYHTKQSKSDRETNTIRSRLYVKSKVWHESEAVKVLVAQSRPTLCDLMDCLLCPWDSLGKNIGMVSHSLLLEIFPNQRSNPGLLHCRQILHRLSHQESMT